MGTLSPSLAAETGLQGDSSGLDLPPFADASELTPSRTPTAPATSREFASGVAGPAGARDKSCDEFDRRSSLAVLATTTTIREAAAHGAEVPHSECACAVGRNHGADASTLGALRAATTKKLEPADFMGSTPATAARVADSLSGNKRRHASAFEGSSTAEHEKSPESMVGCGKFANPRQQPCSALTTVHDDSSPSQADLADSHPANLAAFSLQAEPATRLNFSSKFTTPLSDPITSVFMLENSAGFSTPCGEMYRIPVLEQCPGAPRKVPYRKFISRLSCDRCTFCSNNSIAHPSWCDRVEIDSGRAVLQCVGARDSDTAACSRPENDSIIQPLPLAAITSVLTSTVAPTAMFYHSAGQTVDAAGNAAAASTGASSTDAPAPSSSAVRVTHMGRLSRNLRRLFRPLDFSSTRVLC